MKNMKNLVLGLSILMAATSCEKEAQAPSDPTFLGIDWSDIECVSNLDEGNPVQVNNTDYSRHLLNRSVKKIIIKDGNGKIHISKSLSGSRIDKPKYASPSSDAVARVNTLIVEGETLIICNTFSDVYLSIRELDGIEIEKGNCTIFIDESLAEGDLNVDMAWNSTIKFEEASDSNTINLETFNLDLMIRHNGNFHANNIAINSASIEVLTNGNFNNYGGSINDLNITLHGSSIYAEVVNSIVGDVFFNGKLHYRGTPNIDLVSLHDQAVMIDEN